jgi:hypothetical protein
MLFRASICTIAISALLASLATVQAFDDAKYPAFGGLWRAVNLGVGGQAAFDPTEPWGRGQNCAGTTANILIGKELYYLSAERLLMPTRKGQPPPDLRHFPNAEK